ncbi:hypothetical protein DFH09DRAFT_1076954 [Mycena vulgaris]|nr:hypothetical protein DFH09DRAFT_1076954 [Mycena vulgaris]
MYRSGESNLHEEASHRRPWGASNPLSYTIALRRRSVPSWVWIASGCSLSCQWIWRGKGSLWVEHGRKLWLGRYFVGGKRIPHVAEIWVISTPRLTRPIDNLDDIFEKRFRDVGNLRAGADGKYQAFQCHRNGWTQCEKLSLCGDSLVAKKGIHGCSVTAIYLEKKDLNIHLACTALYGTHQVAKNPRLKQFNTAPMPKMIGSTALDNQSQHIYRPLTCTPIPSESKGNKGAVAWEIPGRAGCSCDITVTLEPGFSDHGFKGKIGVTFRDSKTVLELISEILVISMVHSSAGYPPGAQRGTHNFVQLAQNFGRTYFLVEKFRKNRFKTYSGVLNLILNSAKLRK